MSYLSPFASLFKQLSEQSKTIDKQQAEIKKLKEQIENQTEIEDLKEQIENQAEVIRNLYKEKRGQKTTQSTEKYYIIDLFGKSPTVDVVIRDSADSVAMFLLGREVTRYQICKETKGGNYFPVNLAFPYEYNNIVKQLEYA